MIPLSFEQWRYCIENECKIKLTKEFAQKRLAVYQDRANLETKKFVSLYGEEHLNNVINWFIKI